MSSESGAGSPFLAFGLASDHHGGPLIPAVRELLEDRGFEVVDFGPGEGSGSVDYPDYAGRACRWAAEQEGRGVVLVCGSGVGMSMAANRYKGIRAALCRDISTARMSRLHNNANVLALGSRVTAPPLACELLEVFIETPFEGGRHERRVRLLDLD